MTTEKLFKQVSKISKEYEDTGEKFNVFSVLRLTRNEVKHSAFIAELLNPKGKHGKGNLFLKEFIEILEAQKNEKLEIKFSVENVRQVKPEHKTKTQGYIDILLTDNKGQKIIIENKIDAPDQPNQLWRYYSFGEQKSPLVYLTKARGEPSEQSLTNKKNSNEKVPKEKLILLSYRDIVKWLEKCENIAKGQHLLYATIIQFSNSIKLSITGQTINKEMEATIIQKITEDENNMAAALEIAENISGAKDKLLEKLEETIMQSIKGDKVKNDKSVRWRVDFNVSDKEKIALILLREYGQYGEFYIDIRSSEKKEKEKADKLIDDFKKALDDKTQEWEGKYNDDIEKWAGVWGYTFEKFKWSELADETKRNELVKKFVGYINTLQQVIKEVNTKN